MIAKITIFPYIFPKLEIYSPIFLDRLKFREAIVPKFPATTSVIISSVISAIRVKCGVIH